MVGTSLLVHMYGFYCVGRASGALVEKRNTGRTRFVWLAAYWALAGVALAQSDRFFLLM